MRSKIEKLLSKDYSNLFQQSLIIHSKNVSLFSEQISKRLLQNNPELVEIARLSGLLHDIGKATTSFQNLLKLKNDKFTTKYSKNKHHEISYGFLNRYLKIPVSSNRDLLLNTVYYHHGIDKNDLDKNPIDLLDNNIDCTIDDISIMIKLLIELAGKNYILSDREVKQNKENANIKIPKYFYGEKNVTDNNNSKLIILRTSLISADRIVSELASKNSLSDTNSTKIYSTKEINDIIDERIFRNDDGIKFDFIKENGYDLKRFNKQKNIVEMDIQNHKTTIVKAPAGFGKTLIGLMWSLQFKQKILWVCPRNEIAKSVYSSIIETLNSFNIKLNVELYYTGKKIDSNHDSKEIFCSDIIVTNIDNFEKPTIESGNGKSLFLVNSANIVFDEFHELKTNSALFGLFITIMKARHRFMNTKSLLLSATPDKLEFLWDSINKTTILPNKEKHYEAAHNVPYNLKVVNEFDYSDYKFDNSLLVFNTIPVGQIFKNILSDKSELFHAKFEEDQRNDKYNLLMNLYGKNANRKKSKLTFISTQLIQASLDISFKNLYESCISPEATLQRVGRTNRYGDYFDSNLLIFNKIKNIDGRGETKLRTDTYDNHLSETWFNHIKKYNNKKITLETFYKIYNEFQFRHEAEIRNNVKKFYEESIDYMSDKIFPLRNFNNYTIASNVKFAYSNKLRTTTKELFFIVRNYDSDTFSEPFQARLHKGFSEDFHEDSHTYNKIIKVYKHLKKDSANNEKINFKSFFEKIGKNSTIDTIRKLALRSDTPYIRFDVVYHEKYGLITEKLLESFKN